MDSNDKWAQIHANRDNTLSTNIISLPHSRYLDAYEKYYFLGEEEDDDSNLFYDEEDQRTRRQRALRVVQSVPSTYNEGQHRIAGGELLQIAISGLKICLSKEEIVL